ncbi:MAG: hypothetical protein J5663_10180 [Bacteroidaceae bacterium]|nr:hypothetical protein [Bacteroidaceae bacterium]
MTLDFVQNNDKRLCNMYKELQDLEYLIDEDINNTTIDSIQKKEVETQERAIGVYQDYVKRIEQYSEELERIRQCDGISPQLIEQVRTSIDYYRKTLPVLINHCRKCIELRENLIRELCEVLGEKYYEE